MTQRQISRNAELLEQIRSNELQISSLTHIRDAARLQANHASAQRSRRLAFWINPHELARAIAWKRRTDPTTAQQIVTSYRHLLTRLRDSDPITGARPLRIDYASLPKPCRAYLAAPFIGLRVGGEYPELSFDHSDPDAGRLLYVHTGGPASPDLWRPHLTALSEWLGGAWEITGQTVNTITLTRREPLPRVIPFSKSLLRKGYVFAGIDTSSRKPLYLPLADMTAGTLLVGSSGSGKSVGLHCLLQSLFHSLDQFEALFLVDGKDGVELSEYKGLSPKIHVLWDERDLWKLTSKLHATMRQRQDLQRQRNIKKLSSAYIGLVIDETSTYTVKPSSKSNSEENKAHGQFIDDLARIARRGRSSGFRCIFACQEPTDNQIPTTVRNNCDTVIGFRLPIDVHATGVFGKLEALPTDPRRLPVGRALIRQGTTGALNVAQFPMLQQGRST